MSSSLCLLRIESRDFSQAEKERTACKTEQIHKITTIFTQNDPRLSFQVKLVVIFVNLPNFLSQLEKNHVTQLPTGQN